MSAARARVEVEAILCAKAISAHVARQLAIVAELQRANRARPRRRIERSENPDRGQAQIACARVPVADEH